MPGGRNGHCGYNRCFIRATWPWRVSERPVCISGLIWAPRASKPILLNERGES